ncbi:MAG: peptidase MA family metallohydrolase [Thermodesulfovibrionales bacterium]|jgi:hypothetical protein
MVAWVALFVLLLLLLLLLLLPLISVHHSYAEDKYLQNDEIIVQFEEPLRRVAGELMKSYPVVKGELAKSLGWRVDVRPVVVLIRDADTFRRIAGSKLIIALAIPEKDIIVIDYSRMNVHPFTLETTLKHELCHLQLHHHIQERNLPRWLDEGICQWVNGGVAEIMTDGKHSLLKEATLAKKVISISELTDRFPSEGTDLLLAYEEGKSIVEYISKEFGSAAVLSMLEDLSRGDDLEGAVKKSLSISVGELENRWRSYLKRETSWFAYISNNLYEVLFFVAALFTVYGFIRMMKRKRDYRDEGDETEDEHV